jgi:hypothetical protein
VYFGGDCDEEGEDGGYFLVAIEVGRRRGRMLRLHYNPNYKVTASASEHRTKSGRCKYKMKVENCSYRKSKTFNDKR